MADQRPTDPAVYIVALVVICLLSIWVGWQLHAFVT